MHFYYYCYRLY